MGTQDPNGYKKKKLKLESFFFKSDLLLGLVLRSDRHEREERESERDREREREREGRKIEGNRRLKTGLE